MIEAALELRGIAKRFGPVHALRGADFTLKAGEVHALLGENGAGKSTLMHVAYGLIRPDAGTILLHGRPGPPRSPHHARKLGIGMVHQHFTAIPALSVAENIALAAGWGVRPAALQSRVQQLLQRTRLPLDPSARAGDLSVALKQRLEILKALAGDATILLLDEPTAVLAPAEADGVLALARRFAAGGASVVVITHKLEEALRAADQVTVLRSGRVTLTGRAADQTPQGLAAAMIGVAERGPEPLRRTTEAAGGPVRVRCVALDLLREDGRGLAIRDAQFEVGAGEVVGVAAIEGNGHRELLRAMAGLVRPLRGRLDLEGPVAFIPEDRTTEGLIPDLDLTQNVVLGVGRAAPWVRRWRLDWGSARERTEALIREFGIHSPSADVAAGALSGGNQQKLVVARALERLPRVIIAENPTRGLDVHAGRAVWQRLEAAARDGAVLIVYSTDLDELLEQVTRVLVVANGRLTPAPVRAGRNEIGEMMLGARSGEAP